jgi:choline/ethanolamine kinase
VDYEYSSINYRGFDFANHWCEYAADYSTEMPHLLDFSRLPDIREQNIFLTAYLKKQYEIEGLKNVSNVKFLEDLNALRKEADYCMVLSHLFWGLWGLIQAAHSSIEFDYFEYALQRFDQAKKLLRDQSIFKT